MRIKENQKVTLTLGQLRRLIKEAKDQSKRANSVYEHLMSGVFGGVYDAEDNEDLEEVDLEEIAEFEEKLRGFCVGATDVEIESSVADSYWHDFKSTADVVQNDDVAREVRRLPRGADFCVTDLFSAKFDPENRVILMSSASGAAYNGDYFDAKVTLK